MSAYREDHVFGTRILDLISDIEIDDEVVSAERDDLREVRANLESLKEREVKSKKRLLSLVTSTHEDVNEGDYFDDEDLGPVMYSGRKGKAAWVLLEDAPGVVPSGEYVGKKRFVFNVPVSGHTWHLVENSKETINSRKLFVFGDDSSRMTDIIGIVIGMRRVDHVAISVTVIALEPPVHQMLEALQVSGIHSLSMSGNGTCSQSSDGTIKVGKDYRALGFHVRF